MQNPKTSTPVHDASPSPNPQHCRPPHDSSRDDQSTTTDTARGTQHGDVERFRALGYTTESMPAAGSLTDLSVTSSRGDAPPLGPRLVDDSRSKMHLRGGGLESKQGHSARKSPRIERDASRQDPAVVSDDKRKSKEPSVAQASPTLVSPKAALDEYRERLARDLERQSGASEAHRMSPVPEESASASATPTSSLPTTSTESGQTVRGGMTPGFIAARTPSYPFPRMVTPGWGPSALQRVSSQSPGAILKAAGGQFESLALQEQIRSDPSTPVSAMTFQPTGATLSLEPMDFDFPTPNLYDLTLMLSAEPGLEAWWNAVVQIMTEHYRAERVTLSIPADSTDLKNVPWGQKATYNVHEEDELSMGYIARGSSLVTNNTDDQSEASGNLGTSQKGEGPKRPGLQSRHSFTSFEETKESGRPNGPDSPTSAPRRPGAGLRSKSYYPGANRTSPVSPHPALNKQALEELDAVEDMQPIPSWETPLVSRREVKGRVLPVLQGLDLEADPLIDHAGITRVVERGKVIALTRNYPYLEPGSEENLQTSKRSESKSMDASKKKSKKPVRSDSATKLSSLLSNASAPKSSSKIRKAVAQEKAKTAGLRSVLDDEIPEPPTPKFEEFEQAPPSPWSQSPAPSPAVRPDPQENPFFTDAMVDEESFNPGPSPQDYTSSKAPETIGVDNSWTVLHIPLKHIYLSKKPQPFKLDNSVLEQKSSARKGTVQVPSPERPSSTDSMKKSEQTPIAILSILTPVIPYPSNLRHSLEYLAPHLATSFSLSRHYSNLETEVFGLQRKRPSTSGFGALGPDGRPLADPLLYSNIGHPMLEEPSLRSLGGSITSPSDYSGLSKSAAGSPSGTPNWDSGPFGLVVDRRTTGASPGQVGGDSYFSTKSKGGTTGADTGSGTTSNRSSRHIRDGTSVMEKKQRRSLQLRKESALETEIEEPEVATSASASDEQLPTIAMNKGSNAKEAGPKSDNADESTLQQPSDENPHKVPGQSHAPHKHTTLHSYGADFATSMQSLPPSTSLVSRPTSAIPPTRTGSVSSAQTSMLPPSDRLKGLMLDLLPAHVFVALPVTGEIVWVNSRYLTYRGQTVSDLVADPWGSIHADDREEYLQAWTQSLRTGAQFERTVRLRRFDGVYRYHLARAVASRDKRGVIVQFIGSYMDIHDQKIAEEMAVRREEIDASEAKHRLLANLIPQIIFTATEDEGITFANEQWPSYTGQSAEESLGLGFMDYVHPDDLAKCRIPREVAQTASRGTAAGTESAQMIERYLTAANPVLSEASAAAGTFTPLIGTPRGPPQGLTRNDSSSSDSSVHEFPATDLGELAKKGILKIGRDSSGRLSYTTEVRLRSKSGEYRWHLIRCVEIDSIDFGNGASSYFGSATDINDHKLLETKLKEAMESKGRFLSNMSHEIRTPLIGISGMVSFLQDTTLNEEQRDYSNTIQTSANSLLMIINDILDLSKVDAGMMKLNFEWFHTRSLIEDVNELVSTMAIAKRLELNYVVEEDVPSWVKGDKVRIRQVLLNVIGNAIKFTAKGEVFSRCKVLMAPGQGLSQNEIVLEFSIVDTGRGFTKEEAELIFKPFSQIDGSSTRQHGGSGLGLVISRQLVELHGGKMDGTAVPGKGSIFTFSARFGLPTSQDYPDAMETPMSVSELATPDSSSTDTARPPQLQKVMGPPQADSPISDAGSLSPAIASSSGSSDPSVRSGRSQLTTRSSVSSVNVGLVHFSEAARASGQDLSQMKLEMPTERASPKVSPTTNPGIMDQFRPPMFSILIICPQTLSREATTKHIETTLPKDVPHQITAMSSIAEAERLISGEEAVTFTHIVINLPSAHEIISVIDQIMSASADNTSVLVLSDSVQRQNVLRLAADAKHQQLLAENWVTFIYKPVKPSRFAVIFDPAKLRDLSIDRNRSSAAQMVESQKQNYLNVEKRIGNKGYRVLLVEDNTINQEVLKRYLKKVGIVAEIANDGVECTEKFFSHEANYYTLILCDLHMPRKDGYQACREIREWERKGDLKPVPIIALSANVMSDVQEKCFEAGFSDYVTKPVDFVDLSTAMSKLI